MKKLAIAATSSAVLSSVLTSSVWAGGLGDAIDVAAAVVPTSANLCAPSHSVDLRLGVLESDNVWEDEIETRGFDDVEKLGLGDNRDLAEGEFAEIAYDWDRCESYLTVGAGLFSVDVAEDGDDAAPSRIEDEATLGYLDVAYGRPLNESIRYFGGLRVLNYESESNLVVRPFFDSIDSETKSSFTGLGPIIGVSYETPNRSSGQFGFFGKASAAAVYGSLRNEERGRAFGNSGGLLPSFNDTTDESNEALLTFDAELGAFYRVTDSSSVSLGVTYKRINDIDFVSSNLAETDDTSFEVGDREFFGAFLGYSYWF